MSILAVAWLIATLLALFGWAGFRTHNRAIDGVDGALHTRGPEEAGWLEAA